MRVRSLALALTLVPVAACDFAPAMPEPSGSAALPDPELTPRTHTGTLFWEDVDTNCEGGAWDTWEAATVLIQGDEITLWLETVPVLSGTLSRDTGAPIATITGAMTFPGDDGSPVDCDVDGRATVAEAGVSGDMQEVLSSASEVQCYSYGHYTIVFDD